MYLLSLPSALAQRSWGTRADGTAVASLAGPQAKAVVLFFVASDCPISPRMFPDMKRLREELERDGTVFWYVYPNGTETLGGVAAHQASFDAHGSALVSRGPDLVRLAHAVATPEVAVLRADGHGRWTAAYTGRIDNRYISFGRERTEVTEHYAERAIEAVLAGKQPAAPVGRPVGCAIMNPGASR